MILAECQAATGLSPILKPTSFAAIAGWADDDHAAAFQAFSAGAAAALNPPKTRDLGLSGLDLHRVLRAALAQTSPGRAAARAFFERFFVPHRIAADGFVTGYYEPELVASRSFTDRFCVPLYRRPADLVEFRDDERPVGWDPDSRFGRRTERGPEPFFDRSAIEGGALAGRDLELAWLDDPVDAFFVHVQGSARLKLVDGGVMRVAFDGKSGHPYTSIGRLAVERGLLTLEAANKDGLEAWLKANSDAGRALMAENRSFIFFREAELADEDGPLGAAGVPLTPGRSLAVDRTLHTFHAPLWVEARDLADPDQVGAHFRRLLIAQDTGSAIVGPARADLFFGAGNAAGALAGRVRHGAEMVLLVPVHSGSDR